MKLRKWENHSWSQWRGWIYWVVWFFHPRSSCTITHILADVQRITLDASCMTILGGRTKQLNIFSHVTGFTSDFLSFIVVEHIRFFHGSLQLQDDHAIFKYNSTTCGLFATFEYNWLTVKLLIYKHYYKTSMKLNIVISTIKNSTVCLIVINPF